MPPALPLTPRQTLRQRLLAERERFVLSDRGEPAAQALHQQLVAVLATLVPQCLGVYWPIRFEFNAAQAWRGDELTGLLPLALPFASKAPPSMHYRAWDGQPPSTQDECGIKTSSGPRAEPDVLLVPCVGYTDAGHRLGYGAGYFDRYLAAHPHVTAIGVAWSVGRIEVAEFAPEAHDQPLMLIVTEQGVVS
jgi:5-formyltetrahydrofolate cyclo-ligase